jgi:hypothetical protein
MLCAWSSQYPHRPIPPDHSRSVEANGTGRIAGSDRAAQASVALWAFLYGAVTLEAAQVFGESKPASGLEFGLDAWLMAVSTRGEPIEALRIKPTKKTANKKVSARESSVRSGK